MPLDGPARPRSKTVSLARGEKRHHRKVASKQRWERIAESKQGPCRVCAAPGPNQLHHLVARSLGGSDTEANIVPVCAGCHARVEARDRDACRTLRLSLTDAEYAYCGSFGEGFLDRRYPVEWTRP